MPALDSRTVRVLFTILVFALAVSFVYAARHTLVVFLFAILFAYLIDPLILRVQGWTRLSRGKAIAVAYLAIFGGLALFLALVGPRLVHEATRLGRSIPGLYEKISSGQIAWQIGSQRGWSAETELKVQHFLASHRDTVLHWASRLAAHLAAIGQNAWWLALIPILAVFFLKDGGKFANAVLELLERRKQRQFVAGVLADINAMLARFIRAQLILALLSLGVYTGVLLLMRVPYAIVLGVVGGVLEFIPVVGPLIAALLIFGISLGMGYSHLLILLVFLGVWRVTQDYYNSPHIMGGHLQLHPLAALFGILVGAEIGGVIGVYLSIPVMASLRIVWRRWNAYEAGPKLVVTGEAPAAERTG